MNELFKKLLTDEQGTEIMEYALVAGLIVISCVVLVASYGTKVLARWTSVNSSFH